MVLSRDAVVAIAVSVTIVVMVVLVSLVTYYALRPRLGNRMAQKYLPPLAAEEMPHVHVTMTTIPERFHSDWFAHNLRYLLENLQGQYTLWVNLPPAFQKTGETYHVTDEVAALLAEFDQLRLHRCSQDWGPLTKVLGAVENPEIPMSAPLFVCDDDIKYLPEVLRVVTAYWTNDGSKVYTMCASEIKGYRGFLVRKLQCLGLRLHRPGSCFRIDDDLLDLYFDGLLVGVPFHRDTSIACSIFPDVPTPRWDNALKYDHRPPMQAECKKEWEEQQHMWDIDVPDSFKPRVAVCMWYNAAIASYADAARNANAAYCRVHGHDLVVSSEDRIPPAAKKHLTTFAGYACQRMPLVRELLHSVQNYDYVVWIDADAAIRPKHIGTDNLRKLLWTHREADLIFSADHPRDPMLNSGVFAVKNTAYSQGVFDRWSFEDVDAPHDCYVQGLRYFKTGADQGCIRYTYAENVDNMQDHALIVPFGMFQTFSVSDEEHPESLVLHVTTTDRRQRDTKLSTLQQAAAKRLIDLQGGHHDSRAGA